MSERCLTPHELTVPPQKLAMMLGTDRRHVSTWIMQGMPMGGCKKCQRVDPAVAREWLKQQGLMNDSGDLIVV